jgi:2,6-dihydroxypseudooxynicotine hydrolase
VERYRSIAEQAEAREYIVTAGQNYLRASLLAHSGQLFCRPEWPEKRSLQEARVQYYQIACGHLGIKRFLIPFGTHSLPAYLWLPNCNEKPPLVIMVPGANSVKEELHRWAGPFVRRGLATLRFDGPGQGEMSPAVDGGIPLRMEDYHLVLTTVIDFVEEKLADKVDTSRIALWGQATGGHLITRVFQYEKRPVAAVNLNGQPDMQAYPFLAGDVQEENRIALGFSSYEETWAYLQAHGDAKPAASAINVPYLLIFGMRGDLAGYAAMQSFAASIGENVQMHSYPDGNHGVFNWDFIMTDAMADWLTEKLSK